MEQDLAACLTHMPILVCCCCCRMAGDAETGWDVFSLHYQLGPPLSSIFTPAAQTCYSQLSKLLWLMRRTERSLGSAWHTLKVRPRQHCCQEVGIKIKPLTCHSLARVLRC